MPPKRLDGAIDHQLDAGERVDTSACTAAIMFGPPGGGLDFERRLGERSAPRAQMHTRQPSATSARALASPSPRLEPVTTATLSVSRQSP